MKPRWGSTGGAWSVLPAEVPADVDVKAIRKADGRLTQEAFAKRYGLSFGTVRDWEQGRRKPDRIARAYLTAIARDPEAVRRALQPPSQTV